MSLYDVHTHKRERETDTERWDRETLVTEVDDEFQDDNNVDGVNDNSF